MKVLDKSECSLVSGGFEYNIYVGEILLGMLVGSTLGAGAGLYLGAGIAGKTFGLLTGLYTGGSLGKEAVYWYCDVPDRWR